MSRVYETSPVRPRNAASLVILRQTHRGPEVLLGRRAAKHRFMPNVYVFPGGRVDPGDGDAAIKSDLHPKVRARLEGKWTPRLSRALAVAALRETWEETGLAFGDVENGSLVADLKHLDYVARAITPPANPIRFHARFFTIDAVHGSGRLADSTELLDLSWVALEKALALPLVDVTEFVLQQVARRQAGWQPPGTPLFSYRNGRPRARYE